jgi:hypothetical protein
LFEGFGVKEREISEESGSKDRVEKNFKINLAGVENVSTFAVPTKTGEYKKKLKARCPRRYKMKDLTGSNTR